MATLDLSHATTSVNMTDPNLVGFSAADLTFSGNWSFFSPAGNYVQLSGAGMTFDASGRALTGTVDFINIDVGNNNSFNPDIRISGFTAAAATLDDGPESFWRLLEGDDTITGGRMATAGANADFTIVGDGLAARAGVTAGGTDTIDAGDTFADVTGDVRTIGSQTALAPQRNYRGGDDQITGLATDRYQTIKGDAVTVYATGRLVGGNDTILIQSSWAGSEAVGDVVVVEGTAGDVAVVIGGDDTITARADSRAVLIGDVVAQRNGSSVRGGDDTLIGGDQGESIYGDVEALLDASRLVGGDDTIWGNGGADTDGDTLVGDAYSVGSGGRVVGGADTIHGGEGNDAIYGEVVYGLSYVTGGNDRLHGDGGDDTIYGQAGNDLLDGGTGADALTGGTGNDTYVIDNALDMAVENAGEGTDTVQTTIVEYELEANFENLIFVGVGDFDGIGNILDNTITAGGGNDFLYGLGGNDRLIGGAGDDAFFGGAGKDVLEGGAGVDVIYGEAGNDRLDGGAENDHLFGGTGTDLLIGGTGDDTFLFFEGDGRDRVADFENGEDVLDLSDFDFASFAAVKALATDVAGDLRIDFGNGDVLVIDDFTRADFTAGDVLL